MLLSDGRWKNSRPFQFVPVMRFATTEGDR